MYCPHCGASVNDASRFCPECGGRLKELGNTEIVPGEELRIDDVIEEPEAEPEEAPAQQPLRAEIGPDLSRFDRDAPRRVVAEVVGDEPEKGSNLLKWVLIAGGVLVMICLCCFLSLIILGSMPIE